MVLNSSQRRKVTGMFLDGSLLFVVYVCVCMYIKHINNGFIHWMGSPDIKGIGFFLFFCFFRSNDLARKKWKWVSRWAGMGSLCKALGENWGISSQSPSLVQIHSNMILGALEVLWAPMVWFERCEREGFQVVESLYPPWNPSLSCGSINPKLSDFLPWKLLGSKGKC